MEWNGHALEDSVTVELMSALAVIEERQRNRRTVRKVLLVRSSFVLDVPCTIRGFYHGLVEYWGVSLTLS